MKTAFFYSEHPWDQLEIRGVVSFQGTLLHTLKGVSDQNTLTGPEGGRIRGSPL